MINPKVAALWVNLARQETGDLTWNVEMLLSANTTKHKAPCTGKHDGCPMCWSERIFDRAVLMDRRLGAKAFKPTDKLETSVDLIVVRAAILDDKGGVHSVPPPGRHHNVIQKMRDAGYEGSIRGDQQGFLLSNGQFARRKPARRIARNAGQLLPGTLIAADNDVLTSEDLW